MVMDKYMDRLVVKWGLKLKIYKLIFINVNEYLGLYR